MADSCPVCNGFQTFSIEHRDRVPVLMNRLYPTKEAARAAPCGVLNFICCKACGFAWNRLFEPHLVDYDEDYENDQSHSPVFLSHIKARAQDVVDAVFQESEIDYLEIGCGQGGFISEVARAAGRRLRSAEGFDPAWRGAGTAGPAGSRIHTCYFDTRTSERLVHSPNVVASRHTIEHVPDPVAFLSTVRAALGPKSRARIFIETPCIEWILQNEAMQDFFYEHCSIFTADSLRFAMEKSGFDDVYVQHVFGGQYLWASGVAGVQIKSPKLAPRGPRQFGDFGAEFRQKWRSALLQAQEVGNVAIWGAGAKGVTFALLSDPEAEIIDFAIDINPGKQGLHLAGSGLEVLPPEDAFSRKPRTIFVMNSNYIGEIGQFLTGAGANATLVPID
ncbi:MAG: methyltransferase domain-containing protein [Alphaproteobacteria bacterium]|nr:methyltransferase domain-containing protein [Alphaproteobacteria bacterium]